ncbi:MAG: phosphatidate cytidylyltransferase, partial [Wenzhouxiangellaceae bacterium]
MLKSRVITSVVLATLVLSALLLLPTTWVSVVLALMFLVAGGWESTRLAGLANIAMQSVWIVLLCACGAVLIWATHIPTAVPAILGFATLGWGVLAIWLRFPDVGRPAAAGRFQPLKLIVIGLILLAAFVATSWLHFYSPWWVVFLLFVIAAADIGAFFTGPRFGGPKLAPVISPGKTWSGAAGGLVAAMVTAAIASRLVPYIPLGPLMAALVALLLVVYSIVGDLLISLFKRHRGLKDTSALLPGHGGMLDRVDSLSAAAPVF